MCTSYIVKGDRDKMFKTGFAYDYVMDVPIGSTALVMHKAQPTDPAQIIDREINRRFVGSNGFRNQGQGHPRGATGTPISEDPETTRQDSEMDIGIMLGAVCFLN